MPSPHHKKKLSPPPPMLCRHMQSCAEHHLFTNTVVKGRGRSDPQMGETVWIQDKMLIDHQPIFNFLLAIQHVSFLPIIAIAAPLFIKIDAWHEERRWSQFLVALPLHVLYIFAMVTRFPTLVEVREI